MKPMRADREDQLRVVCWNMAGRAAGVREEQWRYLLDDLDPDIALLQEVKPPPAFVRDRGLVVMPDPVPARRKSVSAVYVRSGEAEVIPLEPVGHPDLEGYFVAATAALPGGAPGIVMSVHGPTVSYRPERFLAQYLQRVFDSYAPIVGDATFIAGGDFNLSRLMDAEYRYGADHPASHGAFFDRLTAQRDLVDCRRRFHASEKRSLYRKGRTHAHYQCDHLFVSREFGRALEWCDVLDWDIERISDHAPVVAVFDVHAAVHALQPSVA